ncbi:MAG: DNA/RNA non-specific endonuclease [Saprospiraceae bacterium]|nr:DNA/RNA non-specific endonuclease [Saprospiraceae bacterium]
MAQLRQNHSRQGKGLQTTFRLVIFLIIAIILLVGGFIFFKNKLATLPIKLAESDLEDYSTRTYLPSHNGEVVHHKHYSLSYVEKYEQPEWTAYIMNRQMLNAPNVPRSGNFHPDGSVPTGSAYHNDYSNSGYTRGHMVPAGDMAFDSTAMRESFYMSNMSPQLRQLNNGIWKELEENVRDWTYKAGKLYIITGPVLSKPIKVIGKGNKVTVPSAFFKVLLDYDDPDKRGIAFIIPHEMSERRLEEYMVTIDEVEKLTGLDFFNDMINDAEEEKLESTIDKTLWNVSDKRYQLRISKWNYE